MLHLTLYRDLERARQHLMLKITAILKLSKEIKRDMIIIIIFINIEEREYKYTNKTDRPINSEISMKQ